MNFGDVTYNGVLIAKGVIYTQNHGVHPDNISLRMIPQTQQIPSVGDVVLSYGSDSLTIPNCLADRSHVYMTSDGFTGTLVLQDKRWRWNRVKTVSIHFNERDQSGTILPVTRKSLREIVEFLIESLAEQSPDVSAVTDAAYPEIDETCIPPAVLLARILEEWGYSITQGFGSDPVTVFQVGVEGDALPENNVMMQSSSYDPPTPVEKVRVCFDHSIMQARFKLEAVGLDTVDYVWKPIDELSYAPEDGWGYDAPGTFPNLRPNGVTGTDAEHLAWEFAKRDIYRVYRIQSFADGTKNLPNSIILPNGDAMLYLENMEQVLPLLPHLLEYEEINTSGETYRRPQRPKVYGVHLVEPKENGNPPKREITQKRDRVNREFTIDNTRGHVDFPEPIYQTVDDDAGERKYLPAELYLEVSFRIRDNETFQFLAYTFDQTVDQNGFGYHNIRHDELRAESVVEYTDDHVFSDIRTNATELDDIATTLAGAAAGMYTLKSADMWWYNRPMFDIRLDGQITQIKHVISDGTDGEPGHYTVVGRSVEFDRFTQTAMEKHQMLSDRQELLKLTSGNAALLKPKKGNAI